MNKRFAILVVLFLLVTATCYGEPRYTDNLDGTVTDNLTSLIWQQDNDEVARTWQESLDFCNNLNFAGIADWRLPNIKELGSIADGTSIPSLDPAIFGGAVGHYWVSTSRQRFPDYAWNINIDDGLSYSINKNVTYYVRCVY